MSTVSTSQEQGQNPPEGQEPTALRPEKGANVKLAHDAKPVTVDGDINIGGHGKVSLPSEQQQRAGFRLEPEAWALLLAQYPRIYKPIRPVAAVPVPTLQSGQQGQQNVQGQQGGEPEPVERLANQAHSDKEYTNLDGFGQGEEAQS